MAIFWPRLQKQIIKGEILLTRALNLLNSVLNFTRNYWKRALTLACLVAVGTLLSYAVLNRGMEIGRMVGHCEVACSVLEAEFTGMEYKYDSACQCVSMQGFVFSIPLDHDYFN